MLHRAEEGCDSAAVIVVADLRFCIGFQHTAGVGFEQFQKSGSKHERDRQKLRCLVSCKPVGHPLISRTAGIHTECNIAALVIDQNGNVQIIGCEIQLVIETGIGVLRAAVIDVVEHLLHQCLVIGLMSACQLTGDHKAAVLEKTLDGDTATAVMVKAVGHNGICNLVTDLVGVSCGYLFTCNDSHILVPPDND